MHETDFEKGATIGDMYRPAMEITDPEEAKAYFEKCVRFGMAHGQTREEAEDIQRHNLGYFAGYYDKETRLRVEELFSCAHPVFGKASNGVPTPEEVFGMGVKMSEGGGDGEGN